MPKAFFRMECGADVSAITDETQLAKLTSRLEKMRDGTERPVFFWPSGCVVEGAVAEHILACGIGLPVDDASAKEVGMTPDDFKRVQVVYDATLARIKHEDMDLFRAGAIIGYDDDGRYLRGPNWAQHAATIGEEDEDEDEDK